MRQRSTTFKSLHLYCATFAGTYIHVCLMHVLCVREHDAGKNMYTRTSGRSRCGGSKGPMPTTAWCHCNRSQGRAASVCRQCRHYRAQRQTARRPCAACAHHDVTTRDHNVTTCACAQRNNSSQPYYSACCSNSVATNMSKLVKTA